MKTRTALPLRARPLRARPRHTARPSASLRRISELGPIALIDASRSGVKPALLRQIQAASPFSEQEWSDILDVTPRTLQRLKREGRTLSIASSERALMIARLLEQGHSVFGERGSFERWLRIPSIPLGGKEPVAFLSTIGGIQFVSAELTRIEHGVLA